MTNIQTIRWKYLHDGKPQQSGTYYTRSTSGIIVTCLYNVKLDVWYINITGISNIKYDYVYEWAEV